MKTQMTRNITAGHRPQKSGSAVISSDTKYNTRRAVIRNILNASEIQKKLVIGTPDDVYEKEADRVAEQVTSMSEPGIQLREEAAEDEPEVPRSITVDHRDWTLKRFSSKYEKIIQPKVSYKEDAELEPSQSNPVPHHSQPVSNDVQRQIQSLTGSGQPLSITETQYFEPRFGINFQNVRIHSDSRAALINRAINARAFTLGGNVVFGNGQYAPGTQVGRKLLAHELTHVVQQAPRTQLKSISQKSRSGDHSIVQLKKVSVHQELQRQPAGVCRSGHMKGQLLKKPIIYKGKKITYAIWGTWKESDNTDVQAFAKRTISDWLSWRFGNLTSGQRKSANDYLLDAVITRIENVTPLVGCQYALGLFQEDLDHVRGIAGEVKVIKATEQKESAETKVGGKSSPKAIEAERWVYQELLPAVKNVIQAKYPTVAFYPLIGYISLQVQKERGADVNMIQIGKKESETPILGHVPIYRSRWVGKNKVEQDQYADELAKQIVTRIEFVHSIFANLPSQVKELTNIRNLTPSSYYTLNRISKKIENMPPEQVRDYISKCTGETADLDLFEASLDKYLAEIALHRQQNQEREKLQNKLVELKEVYKEYLSYREFLTTCGMVSIMTSPSDTSVGGLDISTANRAEEKRKRLEAELKAHKYNGITAFEADITKFIQAFEDEAASIAIDLLGKFAGILYRESQRFRNQKEVDDLYQKLSGFREEYREFESLNEMLSKDRKKRKEIGQSSFQGVRPSRMPAAEVEAAIKKGEEHKAVAESQIKGLANDYPVFAEQGLEKDKRIDKVALAKAKKSELGGLLLEHIQSRMNDISKARSEIAANHELIYKMEELMPHFCAKQGIRPDSIHDMIIKDKMNSDAIQSLVGGIAVAIAAIALAVVTCGTTTPAAIAASAGVLGIGLSGYQVYETYQEYVKEKKLADVGFAKDPSLVWLVLAVAGAVIDMTVAGNAINALGKAAKTFNSTNDLVEFTKVVRALENKNVIETKIARAVEKAAAARTGLTDASSELMNALSKFYSFPGPLADRQVYEAVVKMARQAIKAKTYDMQKFIEELNLLRVKAKLAKMEPNELVRAKQAWEEAKVLEVVEEVHNKTSSELMEIKKSIKQCQQELKRKRELVDAINSEIKEIKEGSMPNKAQEIEKLIRERELLSEKIISDEGKLMDLRKELKALNKPFYNQVLERTIGQERPAAVTALKRARATEGMYEGEVLDMVSQQPPKSGGLHVDHLVSRNRALEMLSDIPGGDLLTVDDVVDIIDKQKNLIAMDGLANLSKGERAWSEWPQWKNYYDYIATRNRMIATEREVEEEIREDFVNAIRNKIKR